MRLIQWAKVEQQRCLWIRFNQKKLRADSYSAVQALSQQSGGMNELSGRAVGRRVVLPSKYVGGPRFMTQLYFVGGLSNFFFPLTVNVFNKTVFLFIMRDEGFHLLWISLSMGWQLCESWERLICS